MLKYTAAIFLLLFFNDASSQQDFVKGVYGHPEKFWSNGQRLNDLKVNAVFLHHKSIDSTFMLRARHEKLKVYAEFATLNGEGYVNDHPEAWAVDRNGNNVEKATWFMGVCPTERGFIQYRLNELKKLVSRFDVDGVWMDYLHWHAQFEDPEPILPETCFNTSCINQFQKSTGIIVTGANTKEQADFILTHHEKAWRKWRTQVLGDWVKQFRDTLGKYKPGALLGIYHCPWNDKEYNGARYNILGLDYKILQQHSDVFSPMVYHKRMGRPASWVGENIKWFSKQITRENVKIWPIVQAYNDPGVVDAAEFKDVLIGGTAGSSTGVMMFTSSSVAEDPQKVAVMKEVYGKLR